MVNTVTGSDLITIREPAAKNSGKKNTEFKDALSRAESTEKKTETGETETDSVDGNQDSGHGEQSAEKTAADLAGAVSWMSVLWSRMQGMTPGQQTGGAVDLAVVEAAQAAGNEMFISAPEQGPAAGQTQAEPEQDGLQQPLLESGMMTAETSRQQEGMTPALRQEPAGKADGTTAEVWQQPEASAEAAAKTDGSALTAGEDGNGREEDFRTELFQTAEAAVTEQTADRSHSQGVSENKRLSSGNEVPRTATMEELPQRILSGLRENRAEFEIQIEPEALGRLTIKASYEEGKAVISILCSNTKTAEILSAHARELGAIMEANLGNPTEIVTDGSAQENQGKDYPDGHAGGRGQNGQESGQRQQKKEAESFLQQLRLGLV